MNLFVCLKIKIEINLDFIFWIEYFCSINLSKLIVVINIQVAYISVLNLSIFQLHFDISIKHLFSE